MNRKVFITQDIMIKDAHGNMASKYDFRRLADLGEVIFCIRGRLNDPAVIRDVLEAKLAGFTKDDYLVPKGDPAIVCMAAIIAARKTDWPLNILVWDKMAAHGKGGHIKVALPV